MYWHLNIFCTNFQGIKTALLTEHIPCLFNSSSPWVRNNLDRPCLRKPSLTEMSRNVIKSFLLFARSMTDLCEISEGSVDGIDYNGWTRFREVSVSHWFRADGLYHYIGNSAAEMPVKFQSDTIIITSNLAASSNSIIIASNLAASILRGIWWNRIEAMVWCCVYNSVHTLLGFFCGL